jgi:ATP synthase protein I
MQGTNAAYVAQSIIGLVVVAIYSFLGQPIGSAIGFLIGIANILMLSLTFKLASKRAELDPKSGMLVLYMSAVVRFILLAVLFVLGLSLLDEKAAFPLIITFVLMQVGQLFNLKGKRRLTD